MSSNPAPLYEMETQSIRHDLFLGFLAPTLSLRLSVSMLPELHN